jgi:putative transcriptional regulator
MYESLVGKLLIASTCVEDPIYSRGVCLVVHADDKRTIGVMLNRPMQPSPEALLKMIGQNQESVTQEPEFDDEAYHLDEEELDFYESSELAEFDEEPTLDFEPESTNDNRLGIPKPTATDEEAMIRATGSLGLVHFGGPLSGPVVAVHGSSELAEAETGQGIYVAAQKQHLEDLVRHKPSPYRLIVGHLGWEPDQLMAEIHAGVWHLVPATADVVFDNDNEMWAKLVRRATAHSVARWIGTPDVPAAQQLN